MFGKSLIFPQEPHPFIHGQHAGRGSKAQLKGGGVKFPADFNGLMLAKGLQPNGTKIKRFYP